MRTIYFYICFVVWAFLELETISSEAAGTCNKHEWQRCVQDYVDVAFDGSNQNLCSNLTTELPCITEHLSNCGRQTGSMLSSIAGPYLPLLTRVREYSCKNSNDAELETCDLRETKSCIKDYMAILAAGHLSSICKQTSIALACLSPVLDKCTGMHRYLVALVADEMQLTSDLWCSGMSCRVDLASQCLENAMFTINYPVAIEMQSNLICSGIKSSLACITNNTDFCDTNAIPQYLSSGFMQLNQFSSDYCTSGTTRNGVMSGMTHDLIPSVYLAALTANEWTSISDMCSMYNATLRVAARQRISMATNIEHLLVWQQTTSFSLDKLSDMCLSNNSYDCKWVEILANQNRVCKVDTAKACVDMVLLSKLIVDVTVMRSSWQTVCSIAYDMLACAQYHTRACLTSDLSEVLQVTREVEDLVGYECSQLGASGSREVCDVKHHVCDSANAVHECNMMAYGLADRCKEQNRLYNCFRERLDACSSIQKVPAQFSFEWLLNNCSTNLTLFEKDVYNGVSDCKIRYGYNVFNGLLSYSDFNSMICTATSLYRQCLSDQSFPSVATFFMQEVDDFFSLMQQTTCNNTKFSSDISTITESEECSYIETAGTITLSIEFYSNFPFMSLKDQQDVCRTYPSFKEIWVSKAPACSSRRQKVISDAIVYFNSMHDSLCSITRPDVQKSCDVTRANICLEDFGAFTYFATENSDVCRKLEETYECLKDSTTGCDEATHNTLLEEVKTMHSMLGNITCSKMQWCSVENTTNLFPWQQEICSTWDKCLIYDWMSCVEQYDMISNCPSAEGIDCIKQKLSSCNPLQFLLAKLEIYEWFLQNAQCVVVLDNPPSVTQVYNNIFKCSSFISLATEISKQDMCIMIDSYLNCLASMDQAEVPRVWRGILGRNGQLWRKRLYMDCEISSTNSFVVGQNFSLNDITGQACVVESKLCLRSLTNLAVTSFHIVPLTERQEFVCERAMLQYDCVLNQAGGCERPEDRYLMTSAKWIQEGLENVGTCSSDTSIDRECSPHLAMECISELGQVLIDDMESMSVDVVCSKLQLTTICVNQRTSSCDYYTRSDVSKTFNQIFAIVKGICTPSPPTAPSTSCLPQGEITQCDLEEALICMVPIQAMLLHPNSTWQQICRSVPEMKACVHRATSGCDDVTLTIVSNKLHRLSHRLHDQCPQIYCEECLARSCIVNLQRKLQYENTSMCGSIAEAKQCIYQHAGYCEAIVSENLLREITMLLGEDAYLCEITLPSCLQNFMISAYQIRNYMPITNMSYDYVLTQMCNEATAAFYCVSKHLTSFKGQRLQMLNATMQQMGKLVNGKCKGPQLQCYSCSNATSNEECNQQRVQTCSPDMQMCGTMFTGTALNKGCVNPSLCQNGCNGAMCSLCCGTSLCNQPLNDVILESPTCQPETALYCGFQMISSLVQNETMNCMHLQEQITCMIQSTQNCMSPENMALGIHARDLLTGDAMSTCLKSSPVCGCGQCSSLLLLSVVSNPFDHSAGFCKTVLDMYEKTLKEMDITGCSNGYLQSTAYNLQMAAYMIQGICYLDNIDDTACKQGHMTYSHGATFLAEDGCNYCTCDKGNIVCTLMYCPPANNGKCPDIDPDQAGVCVEMCSTDNDCYNGQICCSNGCGHVCTSPKPQGSDSCSYGNSTYKTGRSFLAPDGCNFCYCYDGMVSCTEMYCPSVNDSCWYNGKHYNNGDSFQADCNSCFCNRGTVACTLVYCPSDENDCLYNGATYTSGDNFYASDGCNHCFCRNGTVGCTKMFCPREQVCDISGVQQCINEASLPFLVSMVTDTTSNHVCLSAVNLLKCVEPKIKGCPTPVLDIVHNAVWWNIQSVQNLCDISDLIWSLHNGEWQTNNTLPDTYGKCSVQNAVQCFSDVEETCSSYQTMIDCVYNFSTGCLSVDMVPVLFELERHIEGQISQCDLTVPEQDNDPFNPIAKCLADFGSSLNNELTVMYLQNGRLDSVCGSIDELVGCVNNLSNIQPAGKILLQNFKEMLSHLVKQCKDLKEYRMQDSVRCHQCQGLSDMKMCDSMPLQECQSGQVCASSLQRDPYTGMTLVTKGCADQSWCHVTHGCNMQLMSCVACCHGDLCNSATNMTANVTVDPRTPLQTTQPLRTTSGPPKSSTSSYDNCQLDIISTMLTSHVLRLMTFNFLPVNGRRHMCKNFEDVFAMVSDHLDPNCPDVTTEHVRKLLDWLSPWTSEVCIANENNKKCSEAIFCISNMEQFTDKNTTCRSISEATSCLQNHYQYCSAQGQMSINSTRQVLSDINFVVCEPNVLTQKEEDVECVSIATKEMMSTKCDVSEALECAAYIQKAIYNPFVSHEEMCRIAKQGLNCIKVSSMNCSMDALGSMSSAVINVIQRVNDACPNIWCPVVDNCTLEPAQKCLAHLETEVQNGLLAGNFSKSVCKSITRTHHCIMNATQYCDSQGARNLLQQFNAIVLLTNMWCNEDPTYHNECLNGLHYTVDNLVNFDSDFVNFILKTNLQMNLFRFVLFKTFEDNTIKNGLSILGLSSSLLPSLRNDSYIIVPSIIGYLFKDKNVNDVDLQALARFIAEVSAIKNNAGNFGDGLNLPGGGYGGLNLPGGGYGGGLNTTGSGTRGSSDGDFGYGLSLAGGYNNRDGYNLIDIDNNIDEITSLLFRSDTNGMKLTQKFLNVMNVTIADVISMIDVNDLQGYKQQKQQLCHTVHELLHCAYGNIYNSFVTSSKRQEFTALTSLGLLESVTNGMCQELECHSCYGLHNIDECNMQPVATCGPLEICQSKFSDGHYYKGCASSLTCEKECNQTKGPCYCCHGHQCNKNEVQLNRGAKCDIQKAVDAANDLLTYSFNAEADDETSVKLLSRVGNVMIRETEGCSGAYLQSFGKAGRKILKLLEVENCMNNQPMSKQCSAHELNTLYTLIHTSYFTSDSVERVCSLFNMVSGKVANDILEGKCCDMSAIERLMAMYTFVNPQCDTVNIRPLCDARLHQSCTNQSSESSEGKSSRTSTDRDRSGTESRLERTGFVKNICSQISKEHEDSNNRTLSDVAVEKPGCDVMEAIEVCLGLGMDCSNAALERLSGCVQNHTAFCSPTQLVTTAMAIDRVARSCGKNSSISQGLISVDIKPQFDCLQDLTKIKATSSEGRPLMSGMCDVIQSVSVCLSATSNTSASAYSVYLRTVTDKVDRFKEFVCSYVGHVEENDNEMCDVTDKAELAVQYLNYVLTTDVVLGNDDCFFVMELEELKHSLANCSSKDARALNDLASWLEIEANVACNANLAGKWCQRSNCDVTMTKQLLKQIGYYLLSKNLNENIVCKKVISVLRGVQCLADNCTDVDFSFLHEEILYIRSVVGTRCPTLTDHLYCNNTMMTAGNKTSENMKQREAINETQSYNNGTRDGGMCHVLQAQMCTNNVQFPAEDDSLYCSKMRSVTEKLSKCVLPHLVSCHGDDMMTAIKFYEAIFSTRYCETNLIQLMFAELLPTGQCYVPKCSHSTGLFCLNQFKSSDEDKCGNIKDIEQCVIYAMEGCNSVQQSALMVSLRALTDMQECETDVRTVDSSAEQMVKCVTNMTKQMENVLNGGFTGSSTCQLMNSYLTCLETVFETEGFPIVVKETANHLVNVVKPSVELICKQTDDKADEEMILHGGQYNERCDTRAALNCFRKTSANALLVPFFSQDGKDVICSHLLSGERCLTSTLSRCHNTDVTSTFFKLFNIVETLTKLTGACSPYPMVCSPEIAMECISNLGSTLGNISPYHDVCGRIDETEICLKQTTSDCDDITKTSIHNAYRQIGCKAYTLCPSAIKISEASREVHKSCMDTADMITHGGTCQTTRALNCLQEIYTVSGDRNSSCRQYELAVNCFFNNMNACEDDIIIQINMYYLLYMSASMDKMCGTTIRHGCDAVDANCDLDHLEDCITKFKATQELENVKARCFAKRELKQCFEVRTNSCPRITRLYSKTKLLLHTDGIAEDFTCDNVDQCVYNYIKYYNVTLTRHIARLHDADNDNDDRGEMDMDHIEERLRPTDQYQCHARLEELNCIESNLKMLPKDVAMVTGNLLMNMDHTFADLCSIQMGLLPELYGCNRSCIECLRRRIIDHNDLEMLLTFISESTNASPSAVMFSSSKFCRLFEDLKRSDSENKDVSCINDTAEVMWWNKHAENMIMLYDTYCNRTCNTSLADVCITQLENDLVTLSNEEACVAYNETLKCLEESVTSCEADIANQYTSKAGAMFSNSSIICYKMPKFEITYMSSVMVEGSMSQQQSISLTMMTPIMDSCYGKSCHMEIFVSMEEYETSKCSSGQKIPQILMDSCLFVYNENDTALTHDFKFYPRVDHKVEEAHNVTVHLIGQLWQDGALATDKVLMTLTMVMEDLESSGVCYLISEPTIKTFDNLLYYSFYQGEFILYEHDVFPEKVHVGFQQCRPRSTVTCPCVVMIQSGDDTFIIDVCRRFGERYHALDFIVYKNNDMTEQTKVYALPTRNFFQFVLPSGAIINVRSGLFLLDVWIKPSALDYGHTSGLCGTYDGDVSNDFTLPDGSVEVLADIPRWGRNLLPGRFLSLWRPETSLFGGVSEIDYELPDNIGTKCACTNSTCTPTDVVETCDFIYGEDITSDLEQYTQLIEVQNRRKRQTTDNVWDNIDYNPDNPPDTFPTWPTGIGLTEANATQTCEDALQKHASWDICSVAIDTTAIVDSCVTNILLSDSVEFVNGFVEDMKVQCKLEVLSDVTIADQLGQSQDELITYLLTLTCLNDCSNHGNCVDDLCQCENGYQGDDCSVNVDTAPEITYLSENLYSGTAGSDVSVISRQVIVYGSGFENTDGLSCHVEQVEISDSGYNNTGLMSVSRGKFRTSGSVLCELSGSLPLTGLLLSVSNNGVNQSNGAMFIFQDPVCYNCDPDQQICNTQPTSCVIDGQCYGAGVYHPTDECRLCDPVSNFWIFKPSQACVSTTSSSKPTSTTPSKSFTTSSSSSSVSMSSSSGPTSPVSSTPAPTSPALEGDKDTQNDNDDDSLIIVISSGAGLIALIIIVTIIFACRLRRKDKKASEAGSTISSSDEPRKQGHTNPGYSRGGPDRPIAGDPVIQPKRITPLYSANFSTEGLQGRPAAPATNEDDTGLHAVDIEIFDEGKDDGRRMQRSQRPVETDPQYDNAGLERRYTIPRPYVAPEPAGIYSESGRRDGVPDYDNVTRADNDDPMPDYYENDGSNVVTRM